MEPLVRAPRGAMPPAGYLREVLALCDRTVL